MINDYATGGEADGSWSPLLRGRQLKESISDPEALSCLSACLSLALSLSLSLSVFTSPQSSRSLHRCALARSPARAMQQRLAGRDLCMKLLPPPTTVGSLGRRLCPTASSADHEHPPRGRLAERAAWGGARHGRRPEDPRARSPGPGGAKDVSGVDVSPAECHQNTGESRIIRRVLKTCLE